ncbi:MAG: CDP-alcohol phosphatidyltransferase family protein [Thermoleophilia bacterium]|nr:CDP-alcohol phosphatidyltransferase family protein [Thermoleophilia bacterium]
MSGRPTPISRVKDAYTGEARRLALRSMQQLGQTSLTPDMLSLSGLALCIGGSAIVYFEYRAWWLYIVGALVFLAGSLLDILDGALARAGGKGTPFGAFLDSTLDRVGEAFMLGAIALVFVRDGHEWAVAVAIAAIVGSFLVSYTRARAEVLGLKGDVGFGSRAERVAVICIGLGLASVGGLPWAVVFLAATAWATALQRILAVRRQLAGAGRDEPPRA